MFRSLIAAFASFVLASPGLHAQAALPSQPPVPTAPTTRSLNPLVLEAQTSSAPAGTPSTISIPRPTEEDWATIYLAKSRLRLSATGGLLLSSVQMQGCTRELLRLQWRTDDPIDLYVIRPDGAAKQPVVLFLYNYDRDTDVFRVDRWCDRARQNGFAVAGFASALSPQRFHTPRPMKEWFVSEMQEALATSTHDVQMILNYLDTRGDLDMQHVGMFGQGSGGAIAILAAAADPRIRTLDLMDPWGDWPDWLKNSKQIPEEERAAYLQPDFLQRLSTLDPVTFLPQLQDRAIRIQQVMSDPVTPLAARNRIAEAALAANQVTRYPNTATEAQALGTNGIVSWFSDQLHSRSLQNGARQQASSQNASRSAGPD